MAKTSTSPAGGGGGGGGRGGGGGGGGGGGISQHTAGSCEMVELAAAMGCVPVGQMVSKSGLKLPMHSAHGSECHGDVQVGVQ